MIVHIDANREHNDDVRIDSEVVDGLVVLSLVNYSEDGAVQQGAASIDRDDAQQIVDHLTRVFALEKKG